MTRIVSRRQMLRQSTLVAGSLCTCQVLHAFTGKSDCCNTPDLEPESCRIDDDRITIDLTKSLSISEPGHAAIVSCPDKKIELIIVHSEVNRFVALSRFCTHGRQVLSYNHQRRLLQCNSYNHSLFDLDGEVWKGPAPKALDSYSVETIQKQVIVYL